MNAEQIKSLIENGVNWKDDADNSLLHHAVCTGDATLVKLCLQLGVSSLAYNKNNESARDVARAWGYDDIAALLDADIQQARTVTSAVAIPYASLQEIRAQSFAKGLNIFYVVASQGLFNQVAAIAAKDSLGLKASDLLGRKRCLRYIRLVWMWACLWASYSRPG
ncbi:MAG: ankyrin repeat domain-containing protein [Proteobacteria bacterium]|nr:ankyrin repeat domain-containing protein [Pseudomonadota bacterium]